MAGRQSRRFQGRPGVNGLRYDEKIEITAEEFPILKRIADMSGINAAVIISRAEGYTPVTTKDNKIELGREGIRFFLGEKVQYHTYCNETDMLRLQRSLEEAQTQANYVLVSIHAHELAGTTKETPGEFLVDFAHRCIDLGGSRRNWTRPAPSATPGNLSKPSHFLFARRFYPAQ